MKSFKEHNDESKKSEEEKTVSNKKHPPVFATIRHREYSSEEVGQINKDLHDHHKKQTEK